MSLNERQSEILKAIIEEHIESAQPIASVELVKKRNLPVSGATVRNIMSDLVRMGYLEMMHVSSGRLPTDRAYRYYITDLMSEEGITVIEEVTIRQKVWSDRYEVIKMLNNAAEALSELTGGMGFALSNDGFITYTGTSHLFDMPEFYEIDVVKALFRLFDDYELASSIFDVNNSDPIISVLVGREIGLSNMDNVSLISTRQKLGGINSVVGIAGPARCNYRKNISIIKHMSELLDEIGANL